MTDEELLRRASRGDESAFLLLYERHRDAVYGFAYRLLGSKSAAEDVAHDCFLSLMQKPLRFEANRASLRTYFYAAARNLAYKHFRRAGQEIQVEELPEESFAVEADEPLRKVLDDELVFEVRKAIGELPPLQREAVILFEYERLTLAEIAVVTNADVGTVKARLYRARQNLKRRLAPYLHGDASVTLERRENDWEEEDSAIFH